MQDSLCMGMRPNGESRVQNLMFREPYVNPDGWLFLIRRTVAPSWIPFLNCLQAKI
jgi:hypothetical protein